MSILEVLKDAAVGSLDLFEAFLAAGYGASPRRVGYELSKIEEKRLSREQRARLRQKYCNLISQLKRDGLIQVKENSRSKIFALTPRGKKKMKELRLKIEREAPRPDGYQKEKGNLTIVAFDVPEKHKTKRNWIREVLKNLDFKMIQKSVWFGRVKIPRQFIDDLGRFDMIDFVEVFEISKAGSLKRVGQQFHII